MKSPRQGRSDPRARNAARRLLVQALYQHRLTGQPWQELMQQFRETPEFARVDADFFRAALSAVGDGPAQIDDELRRHSDISPERLDPVEHAILRLGLWELMTRPDVPYRVVINEAVGLAKRFGATEGHRYVNAVLDRASQSLRPVEHGRTA